MDATATLTDIKFNEAKRGYDPVEVDNFLEKLGDAVVKLQDKVREASRQADEAATRATAAEHRATELERRALDAEAALAAGGGSAPADEAELTETLKKTLLLAQRTADDTVKEAKADADRLRTEARQQAARMVDEANRDAAQRLAAAEAEVAAKVERESQDLVTQITKLERLRDDLLADVELLETHLASVREGLAAGVTDLREVIEHPERLRARTRPTLRRPVEKIAPPGAGPSAAARSSGADDAHDADAADAADADADAPAAAGASSPVESSARMQDAAGAPASPTGAQKEASEEVLAHPAPPEEPASASSATEGGAPVPADPGRAVSGRSEPGSKRGAEDPAVPATPAGTPAFAGTRGEPASRQAPLVFSRPPAGTGKQEGGAGKQAGGAATAAGPAPTSSSPVRPTGSPVEDAGPPTQPIDLTEEPSVDDGFLDELRRAVDEDNPLGPGDPDADAAMQAFFEQDHEDLPRRGRFGRRR